MTIDGELLSPLKGALSCSCWGVTHRLDKKIYAISHNGIWTDWERFTIVPCVEGQKVLPKNNQQQICSK